MELPELLKQGAAHRQLLQGSLTRLTMDLRGAKLSPLEFNEMLMEAQLTPADLQFILRAVYTRGGEIRRDNIAL